jgi:hypothetical protein
LELKFAKMDVPYLEPRVVNLNKVGAGKPENVVSFHMGALLERMLQNNSTLRKAIIAKSDEYKRGDKYQQKATEFADYTDGSVARFHPHLLRPATEGESDDIRIGLFTNCDDVEVRACLGLVTRLVTT